MFSKILIANRGEIAVRIIRAARQMGINTVQIYSTADADSLAVQMADEAVEIGPPPAARSYLNIPAVMAAAQQTGADAIHPGYGFLSENADFADAVAVAGFCFIGPTGDIIRIMGDKAAARKAALAAGVPVVPGSDGVLDDLTAARKVADDIGYPVMIKATAGGGGRGIRIAHNADQFDSLFVQAAAEAKAAFGNSGLYIEKLISHARHIEVQILGDGKRFIHLFERECSVQRRRQKVWEEGPSSSLTKQLRAKLCRAAVKLARAVDYQGAGTVEFLYDERTKQAWFIEMNTRIQVEHPVTEMITGVDIVQEMIRIASGLPLALSQNDICLHGHAIEARINAEDPAQNFMPYPGKVDQLIIPQGPGIRFDHMLYQGYQIPPFYDSLIGKLVIWAKTRDEAIDRLSLAVDELSFGQLKTTTTLFQKLCRAPDIRTNQVHTGWLEGWLASHTDVSDLKKGA